MTKRASTTELQPGEHSIDRNTPRKRDTTYLLDWSVRLRDGKLIEKRSQGPSKSEVRRRAKVKAAELLAAGGTGTWKSSSPMVDYLDKVSQSAIEQAKIRSSSQSRYLLALRLLGGQCADHQHKDSLKGHSIGSAVRFRTLESCLKEIAWLHGSETARQSRTVLSKYVVQQLIRDELITGNPLHGMSIDLSSPKQTSGKKGGVALSRKDFNAVVNHLLSIDPADGQKKPKRGRWSLNDRIAKRRNTIDLTLLQAATGLRVSEANQLTFAQHISVDDDGVMHIDVPEVVSKTHRARRVPVLDDRVAERLLERQNAAPDLNWFVIGSPADQTEPWDRFNCQKATTVLYKELADELKIEAFETERTHIWRATLNSLLLDTVPEVIRAAHFGHDAAVNRSAYTDLTDTSSMVKAARGLRAV